MACVLFFMKANTKKTIKIWYNHLKKYKISVFFAIFTVVCATSIDSITPLFYKKFFDALTSGQAQDIVINSMIGILIQTLLVTLAAWVFWRLSGFLTGYFESHVMADLLNSSFRYLLRHSYSFFNNSFVGSLVKKVSRFSNVFETISDRFIFELIPLFVSITIITIVLAIKSWLLGFFMITWIIVFLMVNYFLTMYKLRYDIQRTKAETESTAILADNITNHNNIKLFAGFEREANYYAGANEKVRRLRLFTWNLNNTFDAIQSLLMIFLQVGILYAGVILWKRGLFTVGDFVLL